MLPKTMSLTGHELQGMRILVDGVMTETSGGQTTAPSFSSSSSCLSSTMPLLSTVCNISSVYWLWLALSTTREYSTISFFLAGGGCQIKEETKKLMKKVSCTHLWWAKDFADLISEKSKVVASHLPEGWHLTAMGATPLFHQSKSFIRYVEVSFRGVACCRWLDGGALR